MIYGSLFSGIGGIDLAFDRAGLECGFQCEQNEQCLTVLRNHWPDEERFGDVHDVKSAGTFVRPDIIFGGFPCQDLSVAGRRAGLAGKRSGLFWEFMRIVGEFRPRWVLLENVPGLLSSNDGRDMLAIADSLGKLGYGYAYRVLDAQWFGVPQRRRRVFIVGCLGDVRSAAQVLFESESLPWDSPPRREKRARVAASLTSGSATGSGINQPGRRREDDVNLVSHTLKAEGHDASEDGTGRGVPIIPFDMRQTSRGEKMTNNRPGGSNGGAPGTGIGEVGDPSQSLGGSHQPAIAFSWQSGGDCLIQPREELSNLLQCHQTQAVAFDLRNQSVNRHIAGTLTDGKAAGTGAHAIAFQTRIARNGRGQPKEITDALTSSDGGTHADSKPHVAGSFGVRRLMPVECLRLQGFQDDWLDGMNLSDSAKYRMIGNSVAVPVLEWIARRLAVVSPSTTNQPPATIPK